MSPFFSNPQVKFLIFWLHIYSFSNFYKRERERELASSARRTAHRAQTCELTFRKLTSRKMTSRARARVRQRQKKGLQRNLFLPLISSENLKQFLIDALNDQDSNRNNSGLFWSIHELFRLLKGNSRNSSSITQGIRAFWWEKFSIFRRKTTKRTNREGGGSEIALAYPSTKCKCNTKTAVWSHFSRKI